MPTYLRQGGKLQNVTKGELFSKRKNWQSARTAIRKHAADIYFTKTTNPQCVVCGYTKHVQVAHRVSVSSFPAETLLTEINHITNLVGLCPNCHWEFDHDLLKLVADTGVEPDITTL